METRELVQSWFTHWEEGNFEQLPLTNDFRHTSPFGTIEGKEAYLKLVRKNREKFLGYQFNIHDVLYEGDRACVRYTGVQGDFSLDVSEWYYFREGRIAEIVAYYHIGEIREESLLK